MDSLYLLTDEREQEDFTTEARYLYRGYFNLRATGYLDNAGLDYIYLSFKHGCLHPRELVDPYEVVKRKDKKMWALLTYSMLEEYLEGKDSVILFYSGNLYNELESILQGSGIKIIAPMRNFTRINLKNRWIDHIITESILS